MADIRIESWSPAMRANSARMLARAFVTNPLHVAAFGADQLAKNEAFFRIGLDVIKGPKYVALEGARVVGFIHWVQSPDCQFSTPEKLRMVPAMIGGFGVGSTGRVGLWLTAWAKHDPRQPHVHLGPIGVDPAVQGRRIGHRLMQHYCDELDGQRGIGYLETDRPENVRFYRRFGFDVTTEVSVLGTAIFLMTRARR